MKCYLFCSIFFIQNFVFSQEINFKERETILCTGLNFFQGYKVTNQNNNEPVNGIKGSPNLVIGLGHHESYFNNKVYIDFFLLGGQKTERLKYKAQSPYFGEIESKDNFYFASIFDVGFYGQLKFNISTQIKETNKVIIDAGVGFDTYYIPPYGIGRNYSKRFKTDSTTERLRIFRSYVNSYDKRFYFGVSPFIKINFKKSESQSFKRSSFGINFNWSPQKNAEGSYQFAYTEYNSSGKIYGRISHLSFVYQLVIKRISH